MQAVKRTKATVKCLTCSHYDILQEVSTNKTEETAAIKASGQQQLMK